MCEMQTINLLIFCFTFTEIDYHCLFVALFQSVITVTMVPIAHSFVTAIMAADVITYQERVTSRLKTRTYGKVSESSVIQLK